MCVRVYIDMVKVMKEFVNCSLSHAVKGVAFVLDEETAKDDDDREVLQDIINNAKLSEGYLNLARDIEVMEAKTPEDIYKVRIFLLEG